MSSIVTHDEGPVSIAAAGQIIFLYTHPDKQPPSMIDMISGQLLTGTSCGCYLYLIRGGLTHLIESYQLTDTDLSMVYNQPFLIKPGETIKLEFYNPTAADQVQWMVNGH